MEAITYSTVSQSRGYSCSGDTARRVLAHFFHKTILRSRLSPHNRAPHWLLSSFRLLFPAAAQIACAAASRFLFSIVLAILWSQTDLLPAKGISTSIPSYGFRVFFRTQSGSAILNSAAFYRKIGDTVHRASKGNNTLLPICQGCPNNIYSSMEMALWGNPPEGVRFGPYYTRDGNSWSFQPESQTTLPVTEPESDGYYVPTQRPRCFDSAHYSMQDTLLDTMGDNRQGIETPERNETLPDTNAVSEMDMLSSKDFEMMPPRFETLRHGERIISQRLPTPPQLGFNSQDDPMKGHGYPQNGITFRPLPYRSASRPGQSPDYRTLENVSTAFSFAKKPFPGDHLSRELQERSASPSLSRNASLVQEPSGNLGTGPRVFFTSSARNLEGTTTPGKRSL